MRVGGRHVIEVRLPDGSLYLNSGEYKLIKPPEKLIFTWEWEKFDSSQKRIGEMKGTLVTLGFHEHGDTTEVVLTHEGFPDTAARFRQQRLERLLRETCRVPKGPGIDV